MEETPSAVQTVITDAAPMTVQAPRRPSSPTTQPSRRNMTTPRMVRSVGVKTPSHVPKRRALVDSPLLMASGDEE